jgi:hypothetical protein
VPWKSVIFIAETLTALCANLLVDEEFDFEDEIIKDHAKNQGIIRVGICRARIRQSKRPHDTHESEEARVRLAEAPKKLVKDNHISHTMKFISI